MKNLFLLLLFSFLSSFLIAQSVWDDRRSVLINADVQTSPPQITLDWDFQDSVLHYKIYKKTAEWEWTELDSVGPHIVNYTDNNVQLGDAQEYRVRKVTRIDTNFYVGNGYILAGAEIPVIEKRGTAILVIEDTHASDLTMELDRLEEDLITDGWLVKRVSVNRNEAVTSVKSKIRSVYNENPTDTKSILLIGRVPVPYSGYINVDGHAEHTGALPADLYYGEFDGNWTDNVVVVSNPAHAPPGSRNYNAIGDGKFDQSYIPSDIDVAVGRIDFALLDTIPMPEVEILRKYLDKNHDFRVRNKAFRERGLITNNFSYVNEGFGQNGLKNFVPILGVDSVEYDTFTEMTNGNNYLMSFVANPGQFTMMPGFITPLDLMADQYETVFTLMLGSYFGDYDIENNFMRVALAEGDMLVAGWAGRPNWNIHHMAAGHHLGYSLLYTQNDSSFYDPSIYDGLFRLTCTNLLGDPTLRVHTIKPPSNFTANLTEEHAIFTWDASPDANVIGYHLYKRADAAQHFERVNPELITSLTYVDSCLLDIADYDYMVRAVELKQTGSGSYYNLSHGIRTGVSQGTDWHITADFSFMENDLQVDFFDASTNVDSYLWDFGDGNTSVSQNPVHTYGSSGTYTVSLTAMSDCETITTSQTVSVFPSGVNNLEGIAEISTFPNPFDNQIQLNISGWEENEFSVALLDVAGKQIRFWNLNESGLEKQIHLEVQGLTNGTYFLEIKSKDGKTATRKKIIRQK